MDVHQIDWRPEFQRLGSYFCGMGGVVQIHFRSDDCAPSRFNLVLKQRFQSHFGTSERASLRVNPADWFTTHTLGDILDQIEQKIEMPRAAGTAPPANLLSDMTAGGDIKLEIHNSQIMAGGVPVSGFPGRRVAAICAALGAELARGKRFLIEVNDTPLSSQTAFWEVWDAGLRALLDAGLVLIYMIGPKAGHQPHEDAPPADAIIHLPSSFEMEDERQDHVYDDLYDIFVANGLSGDAASAAAATHLATTKGSVSRLHTELAGVLMTLKARSAYRI